MPSLLNLLTQLNSAPVVILGITLIVTIVFVSKISNFLGQWKTNQKFVDKIPTIEAKLTSIDNTIVQIYQKTVSTAVVTTSSPAHLSEVGKNIVKSLEADKILLRNEERLINLVDEENPQNAYDVQQTCFSIVGEHIEKMLTANELEIAKEKSLESGILLSNTLSIFAVLLRDKILEKKGISLKEVDNKKTKYKEKIYYSFCNKISIKLKLLQKRCGDSKGKFRG